MNNRNDHSWVETTAVFLLILLWVYTAGSKLIELRAFRWEMRNQVFAKEAANFLVYFIPAIEILAAVLLLSVKSRIEGFVLSLILMFSFTLYVGLALLNVYARLPCSCGGVLEYMSWQAHFIFNLFFTAVALTGTINYVKRRRAVTAMKIE